MPRPPRGTARVSTVPGTSRRRLRASPTRGSRASTRNARAAPTARPSTRPRTTSCTRAVRARGEPGSAGSATVSQTGDVWVPVAGGSREPASCTSWDAAACARRCESSGLVPVAAIVTSSESGCAVAREPLAEGVHGRLVLRQGQLLGDALGQSRTSYQRHVRGEPLRGEGGALGGVAGREEHRRRRPVGGVLQQGGARGERGGGQHGQQDDQPAPPEDLEVVTQPHRWHPRPAVR